MNVYLPSITYPNTYPAQLCYLLLCHWNQQAFLTEKMQVRKYLLWLTLSKGFSEEGRG